MLAGALIFYVVYHTTKFRFAEASSLRSSSDAAIIFDVSQKIVALADYPARLSLRNFSELFPYPPPTVLIFAALTAGGRQWFIATWLILMAAGLLYVLKNTLSGEAEPTRAAWLLIGALALVVAGSPVAWDLRSANSNLIYLGVVMLGYANAGRRPILAGCCVGLSIALKLYSGLLLGWLVIYRPKAAVAGLVASVCLWLALPLATFGPTGTLALYDGWLEQVRIISGYWVYALDVTREGPPLVTLRRAAMTVAGAGPGAAATRWIIGGLLTAWTALLIWYVQRAWKAGVPAVPSRAMLADWVVLLLAPLPFSPWLEPYHAIALLPAALLLTAVAFDPDVSARDRLVATASVVGVLLVREIPHSFSLRGFSLLAQFALLVGASVMLRGGFGREARPASRTAAERRGSNIFLSGERS